MTVQVCGLTLPSALVQAMEQERWPGPVDLAVLAAVFGEQAPHADFYPLESLQGVNVSWHQEDSILYVGHPSTASPPGDVDPRRSLLIGDLGPDQMIALDYRDSLRGPSVIYCGSGLRSPWHRVADSVEDLLIRLAWAHPAT